MEDFQHHNFPIEVHSWEPSVANFHDSTTTTTTTQTSSGAHPAPCMHSVLLGGFPDIERQGCEANHSSVSPWHGDRLIKSGDNFCLTTKLLVCCYIFALYIL
jgi:hypothetical protein